MPGARAVIVKSITDLERLRFSIGSGPLFAVMSRERAKLSYRWKAAVVMRWAVSGGTKGTAVRLVRDEETGEPYRVPPAAPVAPRRYSTRTACRSPTGT